jgi:lysophospholipase L1-like esterase/PKD repeat protein
VGFSNGTLATGTSFELIGSGVPGSFLDANASTGLVSKSLGSSVPGRYVFEVRNGTPPPQRWVAMGDSYQAGVGTNDYYPASGECQRSPLAYAPLLTSSGAIVRDLDFVACSGARTADLYDGRFGEPAQLDSIEGELGKDVALVTVGIGGNDMEFGGVLRNYILTNLFFETCEEEHGDVTNERFNTLAAAPGGSGLTKLQQVYRDIRFEAYRAQTMVLNYPRLFREEADGGGWTGRCQGLRLSDQLWINDQIRRLDEAIVDAALTMGVRPVDLFDASIGRELCNPDGNETFINGLTRQNNFQDSFHPSRLGYELIADRLLTAVLDEGLNRMATFSSDFSRQELTIRLGETLTVPFHVPTSAPSAGFSTSWPSGDVVMSLRSPSGRMLTRDLAAADVLHELAPTQELFYVKDPEPGEWTIELNGADVSGSGDVITLSAHAASRPNQRPTAAFDLTRTGNTVTVDGRASSDTDGSVNRYIWEFDDGTILEGPVVSHRYIEPGEYLVTLTVIDDGDAVGVATAESTVTISRYEFTGFEAPVAPAPTVNTMNAGRAVPLKFGLGGDRGLDVLAEDSPSSNRVDCESGVDLNEVSTTTTSGASSLQYDPLTDRYTYVWKTNSTWAGQCRNLTVTFDDGSSSTLHFKFR